MAKYNIEAGPYNPETRCCIGSTGIIELEIGDNTTLKDLGKTLKKQYIAKTKNDIASSDIIAVVNNSKGILKAMESKKISDQAKNLKETQKVLDVFKEMKIDTSSTISFYLAYKKREFEVTFSFYEHENDRYNIGYANLKNAMIVRLKDNTIDARKMLKLNVDEIKKSINIPKKLHAIIDLFIKDKSVASYKVETPYADKYKINIYPTAQNRKKVYKLLESEELRITRNQMARRAMKNKMNKVQKKDVDNDDDFFEAIKPRS